MDTQGKRYPRTKGYNMGFDAAVDSIAANWLQQRLEAAQALRNGAQPETGALNYVQPLEGENVSLN